MPNRFTAAMPISDACPQSKLRIASARDAAQASAASDPTEPQEIIRDLRCASLGLQDRVLARVGHLATGRPAAYPALGRFALAQLARPAAALNAAVGSMQNAKAPENLEAFSGHLTQSYIALTQTSAALQSLDDALFGFGTQDTAPEDAHDPDLMAAAQSALRELAQDLQGLAYISMLVAAPSPQSGPADVH